jgi:hypothetical protein
MKSVFFAERRKPPPFRRLIFHAVPLWFWLRTQCGGNRLPPPPGQPRRRSSEE